MKTQQFSLPGSLILPETLVHITSHLNRFGVTIQKNNQAIIRSFRGHI
jgi:hypothetical protein